MNTIEDLRATLHAHADDPAGRAPAARAAAVHQRVAVVRRRRRGAVAGAAAAAVAVVGGVTLLPRDDAPDPAAERRLAGHLAPKTIDSLGYTFGFDRGYPGEGRRRVELDASDGPLVVTWAASSDDLEVRSNLDLDGDSTVPDKVASPADFSNWALVDLGTRSWLELRSSGDVAVAVYTLTRPAPGYTKDGMTYREETPDGTLLEAVVGDQGQTEVTLQVTLPEGLIGFDEFCSATRIKTRRGIAPWVKYYVDGEYYQGSSCSGRQQGFDLYMGVDYQPGGGLGIRGRHWSAGDRVTLTARLVADERSDVAIQDGAARLAMALYGLRPSDDVIEQVGHTYSRLPGPPATVTGRVVSVRVPVTGTTVIPVVTVPGRGFQTWEVWVDGKRHHRSSNGLGQPFAPDIPPIEPWMDRRVELRLVVGTLPDGPVRVRYYGRVD